MQPVSSICGLRIVVGHLGEKPQAGWWDTAFLNPTGFRYLGLVFPKTTALASVTAASEAACREHDERIGKGRVAHLFRLSAEGEMKLRAELGTLNVGDIGTLCFQDGASRFLEDLAAGAKATAVAGPVQIGSLKDLESPKALARLAAVYAAGFNSGTRVFPYFA